MATAKVILVTGGAGFIGSHTCLVLLQAGYSVVVVDNLCNSQVESLRRVERLTGQRVDFYPVDIRDEAALSAVFDRHQPETVIHFAGLKAVGESVAMPLSYYDNNVNGTLVLLRVMQQHGIRQLVFSSSATVYGNPASVPIREDFPLSATNPYGRSKLMVEEILRDWCLAQPEWKVALLRYFNPVGAHESGEIGEDPGGIPNNLMPFVSQVAVGKRPELSVFGSDYPTVDGTGVRDYIHVMDLSEGHLAAVRALENGWQGCEAVNLGTGHGYSVLQMVAAFEHASGKPVPYRVVARRPGDIAECYADPAHAARILGWRARRGLDEMCMDAWRWQSNNPDGFAGRANNE